MSLVEQNKNEKTNTHTQNCSWKIDRRFYVNDGTNGKTKASKMATKKLLIHIDMETIKKKINTIPPLRSDSFSNWTETEKEDDDNDDD